MLIKIHQPVLADPTARVQAPLVAPIQFGGDRREDLDDQIRRPLDVCLGQDVLAPGKDEELVGLGDIVLVQHDIAGTDPHLAERTRPDKAIEQAEHVAADLLMKERGRDAHTHPAIEQLVLLCGVPRAGKELWHRHPRWNAGRQIVYNARWKLGRSVHPFVCWGIRCPIALHPKAFPLYSRPADHAIPPCWTNS